MALDVYRDLSIEGSYEQLTAFVDDVEKRLYTGWRRDHEVEADTVGDDPWPAFTCEADEALPRNGATISLMMEQGGTSLDVMNIVPTVVQSLGFHGYNRILMEFHDAFAKPAAAALGLEVRLTDDLYRVEERVSPKTYDELRSFSLQANRGVPFASDMERWRRVLLSLHAEGWPVDSETLTRWLVEEEGWPEDRAWELRAEIALARDLLQDYDLARAH